MLSTRMNEVKNEIKDAANEARAYPEVADIKNKAADIKDDAASLMSRVKADGSALASKVGHEIQDHASETYESLKASTRKQADKLEARVHADPLKAVLMAAGVGFVVGFLSRR